MRNSLRWLSVVALGSCLAVRPATAQIEAGDRSLMFQAFGQSTPSTETTDGNTFGMAYVGFNIFHNRNLAWRLNATQMMGGSAGESSTGTLLGGGLEWNFNSQGATRIPFVAVDVSQFLFPDANATMFSASVGLRSFLSRSTSFDVAPSYNMILAGGEEGGSFGFYMVRIGFSFFLGKDSRR